MEGEYCKVGMDGEIMLMGSERRGSLLSRLRALLNVDILSPKIDFLLEATSII